MRSNKTLIALSTAIVLGVLGAGSAAFASDHEDGGGFKIGPLGQIMGTQTESARGANAYAFAPAAPSKQTVHKQTAHSPANAQEDNYGPEAGKD
jgi:hypothetical protein